MAETVIAIAANENGWHENARSDAPRLRDGWAVVREADLPLLRAACGVVTFELAEQAAADFPTVVDLRTIPGETYPVAVNLRNVYVPPTPPPAPEPSTLRETAYNTEAIIAWQGKDITVTAAAELWTYYTSEGDTATATALTEKIAAAKTEIRERYPDTKE